MLIDLNPDELYYYPLSLLSTGAMGAIILLKISLVEYVFLIKWKT